LRSSRRLKQRVSCALCMLAIEVVGMEPWGKEAVKREIMEKLEELVDKMLNGEISSYGVLDINIESGEVNFDPGAGFCECGETAIYCEGCYKHAEERAYQEGKEQGYNEGYEDGYRDGYNRAAEEARSEIERVFEW